MTIIIALLTLGGLTFLLAGMLAIANQKLYVYEDPRIDEVEDRLPKANCGACGYPGCRPFAEALVSGEAMPSKCTVSDDAGRQSIAQYLGVSVGDMNKQVARLACAGGTNVARQQAQYKGLASCRAAALVSGGGKGCSWGCLGFGDCEISCDFDAIRMDAYGLPVVDVDKCTACGDCVEVCPKELFSLQPLDQRLWVACKNEEAGQEILEECQVACYACGKCAMDAPDGLISMTLNLPVIDYRQNHYTKEPIQRCPTGAIGWLNDKGELEKGPEAKKIVRKSARPMGYS